VPRLHTLKKKPKAEAIANRALVAGKTIAEATQAILAALKSAAAEGRGAAQLDGKVIDAESARMAENVVNIDNLIKSP
jgi:citrate lyase subunit beta/citryl-CoA lyase